MSDSKRKSDSDSADEAVRVDKWLWAARFFRTRSLASKAVKGGKVHINAQRAKASSAVRVGDRLDITKGETAFAVDVRDLAVQRGPAQVAQTLYAETEASRERREARAEERRAARIAIPRPSGRPDRKDRRALRRFKQGE